MGVCTGAPLRADVEGGLKTADLVRGLVAQGGGRSVIARRQSVERIGYVCRHLLALGMRWHVMIGRHGYRATGGATTQHLQSAEQVDRVKPLAGVKFRALAVQMLSQNLE